MKLVKPTDKHDVWSLVTENYTMYFTHWCCWWDLALPLHINIEWWNKEYTEIQLHILGFSVSFTRIHKRYGEKLDRILEDYKNRVPNEETLQAIKELENEKN